MHSHGISGCSPQPNIQLYIGPLLSQNRSSDLATIAEKNIRGGRQRVWFSGYRKGIAQKPFCYFSHS